MQGTVLQIDEYLRSEKARIRCQSAWVGYPRQGSRWQVSDRRIGPWFEVQWFGRKYLPDGHQRMLTNSYALTCYVRKECDEFIASDLGLACFALRQRTGRLEWCQRQQDDTAKGCCPSHPLIASVNNVLQTIYPVCKEDVPAAVCRIVLATWRIYNLPTV